MAPILGVLVKHNPFICHLNVNGFPAYFRLQILILLDIFYHEAEQYLPCKLKGSLLCGELFIAYVESTYA
ncbi:unnamed protein product [Prunus armeniaca]